MPTLLFVNKIDRRGADAERMLDAIEERLTPAVFAMGAPAELGTRAASFAAYGPADEELGGAVAQRSLHPVFFGSALTGAGIEALMAGVAGLLPAPPETRPGRSRAASSRSSAARPASGSPMRGCSRARCGCATASSRRAR